MTKEAESVDAGWGRGYLSYRGHNGYRLADRSRELDGSLWGSDSGDLGKP